MANIRLLTSTIQSSEKLLRATNVLAQKHTVYAVCINWEHCWVLGWVSLTRVVLYCRLWTSLVGKISGMASEAHSPQSSRRTECHFLGWLGGDVELSDMHCACYEAQSGWALCYICIYAERSSTELLGQLSSQGSNSDIHIQHKVGKPSWLGWV